MMLKRKSEVEYEIDPVTHKARIVCELDFTDSIDDVMHHDIRIPHRMKAAKEYINKFRDRNLDLVSLMEMESYVLGAYYAEHDIITSFSPPLNMYNLLDIAASAVQECKQAPRTHTLVHYKYHYASRHLRNFIRGRDDAMKKKRRENTRPEPV